MIVVFAIFAFTILTLFRQKHLSDMKNDFIANVSHELKTPIGTGLIALKVLQERESDGSCPGRLEMLAVLQRQLQRLDRLVLRVVDLTINETSGLTLERAVVSLHPVLTRMFEDFKVQWQERDPETKLQLEATRDLVLLDEFQFVTAIQNILDNAMKYSSDCAVISLSTLNEGDFLEVRVADRGMGMKPQELSRIFDKFYRVGQGREHRVKGLGLGLYAAKAIVLAHGGTIHCTSRVQMGSTFVVRLPLHGVGGG